jgi:hypothetical protein
MSESFSQYPVPDGEASAPVTSTAAGANTQVNHWRSFARWRRTDSVHPEDVAGIIQKWQTSLESVEPFEAEARVRPFAASSANRCEVATNSRFSKML